MGREVQRRETPLALQVGVERDTACEEQTHQQGKQNHLHDRHFIIVTRDSQRREGRERSMTGQTGLDQTGAG